LATPANNKKIFFKSIIKDFFIWVLILLKVKINILRNKEKNEITVKDDSKVEDILKKINLKPDTVVVMNKKIPIPIDETLKNGMELDILQVSSGG